MNHRNTRGFTLIELLIVVAVIGLITAIAIPNLLNAIDRGKQKRTMASLRSIGSAVEQYAVDHQYYPQSSAITALKTLIEPVYIGTAPQRDAWNRDFVVDVALSDYTIGSGGKDGGTLNYVGGATSSFNDAIIFADGRFIQWPEGAQQ